MMFLNYWSLFPANPVSVSGDSCCSRGHSRRSEAHSERWREQHFDWCGTNLTIWSIGNHCCPGQQAGQAGREESGLERGPELGKEWEGASVGGVRSGATYTHRAFCVPCEQNDAATEQIHFPSQPQQEQRQRVNRQLKVQKQTSKEACFIKTSILLTWRIDLVYFDCREMMRRQAGWLYGSL